MRLEDTILMKLPIADPRYPVRREFRAGHMRWVKGPRFSRAALSVDPAKR